MLNLGDRVRRSAGLISLHKSDAVYREAARAETFLVEGVEFEDIGWDQRWLTRLKVNGEWGPAQAWEQAEEQT